MPQKRYEMNQDHRGLGHFLGLPDLPTTDPALQIDGKFSKLAHAMADVWQSSSEEEGGKAGNLKKKH